MNRGLRRPIAEEEIRSYDEDGAVCVRGQFDRGWIDRMLDAVEANLEDPAGTVLASGDDEPGRTIANSHMARGNPAFMDFVKNSPAREIAARLMGLDEVRYFYDQLFIKEPGTRLATAWHHDLPFWPLAGNHVASVWLALTPVTRETSGLVYVAGSHRWDAMYRPVPAVPREGFALAEADALPDCPPFHKEFGNPAYRFLSWDMEAGDCIVHHPMAGARRGRQPGRRGAQGGAVVPLLRRRHKLVRPPDPVQHPRRRGGGAGGRRLPRRRRSVPRGVAGRRGVGGRPPRTEPYTPYPASAASALGRYSVPLASIRVR